MLNPKLLRENIHEIATKHQTRDFNLDTKHYQDLEDRRKILQQDVENLQAKRNTLAKQIGEYKKQGKEANDIITNAINISQQLTEKKAQWETIQQQLQHFAATIPNVLDSQVPDGKTEDDNVLHSQWGEIPTFDFTPLDHIEICEKKGWLDFPIATQLAGSRFSVLKGPLALLHRALSQFMLDCHTQDNGYQEINAPIIVNEQTLYGTGQLPKFKEDLFSVHNGDEEAQTNKAFYLIPTAEVTLTNLVAKQIIAYDQLPLRYCAHTPCFRSEAGNSGRDIRGLIRQHQFEKVELVQVVDPKNSWQALEEMVRHAECILESLGLAYRRVTLCSGDVGFSAAFTYDLEVWLPSQQTYREISSISNCLDFQARRMMARLRNTEGETEFVHTLNGSGVAIGRAMLAVIENYQQSNGDIAVPKVLQPYMHGKKII